MFAEHVEQVLTNKVLLAIPTTAMIRMYNAIKPINIFFGGEKNFFTLNSLMRYLA